MLLQLLQLVLGISIYAQIFFSWYDSFMVSFFHGKNQLLEIQKVLSSRAKYIHEISLVWMYRCLRF